MRMAAALVSMTCMRKLSRGVSLAPSPGSNELVFVIGLGGQKAVFGP
jgi:hypothetical protein